MKANLFQLGFFATLTLIVFVLAVLIFLPYLSIIFLSGIISVVFYPIFKKISNKVQHRTLGAFLSVLIILLIVLLPILAISFLLFQESITLYQNLAQGGNESVVTTLSQNVNLYIDQNFPAANLWFSNGLNLEEYIREGLSWLAAHIPTLFTGLLKGALGFFLIILSLFYFIKDGNEFIKYITELSPLESKHNKHIVDKLSLAINSVVKGYIIIGFIQGILTGVGFALFGVPNPVIWGSIAAIASFIPSVGTGLILIPGVLYLFFINQGTMAIGLLIWGVIIVGLVDNVLGPLLIKRGVKIHPIIILFSVLGGLALVGPIGFIFGPVLISLLYALLEIYSEISTGEIQAHA